MTLLLPLLAFVFVSLLVAGAAMAFAPRTSTVVEQRLIEIASGTVADARPSFRQELIARLKRLGEMAPKSAAEMGKLQRKLVAAGYRRHEAIWIFFGIRIGVAFACFV